MGSARGPHQAHIIPVDDDDNVLSDDTSSNDSSSQESITLEAYSEEESSYWTNKKHLWKAAGVVGATMTTLTYFTTYELTHEPFYSALSTIAPVVLGLSASYCAKRADHKDLEIGFSSFTISSIGTTIFNGVGALIPFQESYPVVIPLVSLNVVVCTNIMTPDLCINVAKLSEKLSKLSDSCFSLWKNRGASQNNANNRTSLDEVVVSERSRLLR